MCGVTTGTTGEFGLALSVGAFAMSAFGARLAGVPGVDLDHGDTDTLRLVRQERVQLRQERVQLVNIRRLTLQR